MQQRILYDCTLATFQSCDVICVISLTLTNMIQIQSKDFS